MKKSACMPGAQHGLKHIKACIFHGYELHNGSAAVDMFSYPNGVVLICPHISLEGSVPSTCRTSSECQGDGALTCALAVADAFADICCSACHAMHAQSLASRRLKRSMGTKRGMCYPLAYEYPTELHGQLFFPIVFSLFFPIVFSRTIYTGDLKLLP